MKFVSANDGVFRAKYTVRKKPRRTVAEMQFAFGEARHMAEQSRHGVATTLRVFEALAQNHVAAALTVHWPRLGELLQSRTKAFHSDERIGMKFRIAARQPAAIGVLRRRLVSKRREWKDLGAGFSPSLDEMWIDEAESLIARQRDTLSRRRNGPRPRRRRDGERHGVCDNGLEIEMPLRHGGKAINQRGKIGMLAGLNKTEMALRQRHRCIARNGAEDRNTECCNGFTHEHTVPLATDTIENNASDAHRRIVGRKTSYQSRGRLRLARDVEHEHGRHAEMRGEIGGRTAPAARRIGAIE